MMARRGFLAVCSQVTAAVLAAAAIGGCESTTRDGAPPIDPRAGAMPAMYPALHDTVGEFAMLSSIQDLRVEGYGLVAELPNSGSGDMPQNVRQAIADELYRAGAGVDGSGIPNADLILNSKRVAAVEVRGVIPALAPAGTVFDLTVNSLAGSQTSSLKY